MLHCRALEKAKNSGNFSSPQEVLETSGLNFDPVPSSSNSNALASHDSGSSSNGTANDDHLDHNGGPGRYAKLRLFEDSFADLQISAAYADSWWLNQQHRVKLHAVLLLEESLLYQGLALSANMQLMQSISLLD